MLHAIVGLLDNSAHIDSYVSYMTIANGIAGIYTAIDKHPAPEKGLVIQD